MSENKPFLLPKFVGQYELEEVIGRGATSYVYRARKRPSKLDVAIKAIPKSKVQGHAERRHLQSEIDVTFKMPHNNIIKILDFLDDFNYYYIIFEYCVGGSLLDYIIRNRLLKAEEAGIIFAQVVGALNYLHKSNIIHRDIKPANILITTAPEIKLTDFGLCGFISEKIDLLTFNGSPCYQPPEVIKHNQYDGKKWDLWSLGVCLYEMVTGSHPWTISNTGKMIQQIMSADFSIPDYVSPEISRIIKSLIQVNPEERISLDELMMDPFVQGYMQQPKRKKCVLTSQSAKTFSQYALDLQQQRPTSQKFGQYAPSIISPFHGKNIKKQQMLMATNFKKENMDALETKHPLKKYKSNRLFRLDQL